MMGIIVTTFLVMKSGNSQVFNDAAANPYKSAANPHFAATAETGAWAITRERDFTCRSD
jgi:hypothetical protein